MKRFFIILLSVLGPVLAGAAAFLSGGGDPVTAACLGDIPAPVGYEREDAPEGSYTEFLRSQRLLPHGAKVHLYSGKVAPFQWISSGVIDRKLISEYEQCADVVIRIRSEYFWKTQQLDSLRFTDVNGVEHTYDGGSFRWKFKSYLEQVYKTCNTESVYRETSPRAIRDVQPGDILVYRSRRKGRLGHAVLVADVARNPDGKVAILCVEGNTPAREMHIVRNLNSFRNPWFFPDVAGDIIRLSVCSFKKDELRHY